MGQITDNSMEAIMRRQMVRYLVQKHIMDPFGGEQVLDVDTCVVILDADGDPCTVMSPESYTALIEISERRGVAPLGSNFSFDLNTIPTN